MLWSCCNKVSQIIMAPKKFSLATVSSYVNNLHLNRSQSLLLKEKTLFALSKWQQKSCSEAVEISVRTEGWGMLPSLQQMLLHVSVALICWT